MTAAYSVLGLFSALHPQAFNDLSKSSFSLTEHKKYWALREHPDNLSLHNLRIECPTPESLQHAATTALR